MFKDLNHQLQQELNLDNIMLEDINFDPYQQPTQSFQETTGQKNQGALASSMHMPPSLASLELLRNYGSRLKMQKQNTSNLSTGEPCLAHHQKMSTVDIVREAGARYVQYSSHWNDDFCIPMHPYGLNLGNLSEEENGDVELVQFLLAAAEKVSCQQFERASRLLLHCQWNSSSYASGNSVQRVVFHFAQALQERIEKETGRNITKGSEKNEEIELLQMASATNQSLLCHQKIPYNQVMQFSGIQAIVEHVAGETKIHLIDFDIKSGVQYTALMQALSVHQVKVKLFKVSPIGLKACKTKIDETGKWLASFAESLNLPFFYKPVLVTDMAEIKEDHFEVEEDEAVVVYSPYFLRTMISRPDCLENLMRIISNIKPSIMIVHEVEANHNSPSFVNRFIEAMFFYSAFFDCLYTCIEDDECKMITEAILSAGIRNIVAMEGKERRVRNVKIDVWRRFFARYRMVETGFSESSMYQANLVAKEFAFGKFCSVDKNGRSMIVGWKGTPMHSISAWRFL